MHLSLRDGMMNDYEEAILALGSTIEKYSTSQEYPWVFSTTLFSEYQLSNSKKTHNTYIHWLLLFLVCGALVLNMEAKSAIYSNAEVVLLPVVHKESWTHIVQYLKQIW